MGLRLILALAFLLTTPAAAWQEVQPATPVPGAENVVETVWSTARPPEGPYDRIRVHRYRGPGTAKAALFYLPGTWMNGSVAIPEERYNLWIYLARRGVEVFTLDYRTHALGTADLADPAILREWTNATFLGDVRAAAEWVRQQAPERPLFLAGFSRGVAFAYAHTAAHPEPIAGIVALDGYFKKCHPGEPFDRAGALGKLEASGAWVQDVGGSRGWAARQALMHGARDRPGQPLEEGASPTAPAAPAGEVLAEVLYRAWGPGVLANPIGGGGAQGVSRPEVLGALMAEYDRYYPAIQDVESGSASNQLDDPAVPWDDGWSALRKPVILFATGGIGPDFLLHEIASASHVGGRQTEIHVLEGFGHLDVLVAETAEDEVFAPLLRWIETQGSR